MIDLENLKIYSVIVIDRIALIITKGTHKIAAHEGI